jgi:hypothetical protein
MAQLPANVERAFTRIGGDHKLLGRVRPTILVNP